MNSQPTFRVLVSGIPGTGKTEFTRWLAEEHGFLRCPQGEEPTGDFFNEVLRALQGRRVVIDWGFPANDPSLSICLDFNKEVGDARGLQPWWFDGDRAAALESFLRRGTVSRSAWDAQLTGIERNWARIEEVFGPRIMEVISTGPNYLPKEARLRLMFPAGV